MSTPLALQISYDGSGFAGFQALPGLRTVQGELEAALGRLLRHPCPVVAAGRTDAGVHAYGQVVSLSSDLPVPPARFQTLLQKQLPPDLAVVQIWPVSTGFHARFSARARHYRYLLRLNADPDPFAARQSWHCPYPVDPEALRQAWRQSLGTHDWRAFARTGSTRRSTTISVWVAELRPLGLYTALDIVADSFLYTMVRTLVGTALGMARGQLPADQLQRLLQEPDRQGVGLTVPPTGLYFCRALYAPEHGVQARYPDPWPESWEQQIPAEALQDPGVWWE
ncbi:MAG: tRNA pseudouridine(38-40) synthase TruA [Candidatus Sericytochromatia bacterium]